MENQPFEFPIAPTIDKGAKNQVDNFSQGLFGISTKAASVIGVALAGQQVLSKGFKTIGHTVESYRLAESLGVGTNQLQGITQAFKQFSVDFDAGQGFSKLQDLYYDMRSTGNNKLFEIPRFDAEAYLAAGDSIQKQWEVIISNIQSVEPEYANAIGAVVGLDKQAVHLIRNNSAELTAAIASNTARIASQYDAQLAEIDSKFTEITNNLSNSISNAFKSSVVSLYESASSALDSSASRMDHLKKWGEQEEAKRTAEIAQKKLVSDKEDRQRIADLSHSTLNAATGYPQASTTNKTYNITVNSKGSDGYTIGKDIQYIMQNHDGE